MQIPKNPLKRFVEIFGALNGERRWFQDVSVLRFAAISAVTCEGTPSRITQSIRATADEIKDRAGWFGDLNSPLRFLVAAILVQNDDKADAFLSEVERVKPLFRRQGLRRGGIYETMSILILRVASHKKQIFSDDIRRLKSLYEEMKKHHWWLTGVSDFPACAALVGQKESPSEVGRKIETIYQKLHTLGFKKGDPLQTASNLLYLAHTRVETVASRFEHLANAFRQQKTRIWQSEYDELAILSFLKQPASVVADRVLDLQTELRELRPKPDRSLAFNLASSLAFLELVQLDEELKDVADAKALMDMQAIITAQQVAAMTAASVAASSGAAAASNS